LKFAARDTDTKRFKKIHANDYCHDDGYQRAWDGVLAVAAAGTEKDLELN